MSQPLRTEVRDVFLQSLRQIWITMAVLCGISLCTLIPASNYNGQKVGYCQQGGTGTAAPALDGNIDIGQREAEKQV
jgi:hypothetical protein